LHLVEEGIGENNPTHFRRLNEQYLFWGAFHATVGRGGEQSQDAIHPRQEQAQGYPNPKINPSHGVNSHLILY